MTARATRPGQPRRSATHRGRLRSSGARPGGVTLVAAREDRAAGGRPVGGRRGGARVGHNYVQELRARASAPRRVPWHYIGTLRSGTAHHVADHADVVETVAGERAARRLAGRAARAGRTLDVLIEVDLTGERTGVAPGGGRGGGRRPRNARRAPAARADDDAAPDRAAEEARQWFLRLRELRDEMRERIPRWWTSRWGCRWITRSRWRKALRWSASGRRCSVREAVDVREEVHGRRVEEDDELPRARRGGRGLRRRAARRRTGAGASDAAPGRARYARGDRGRRAHDAVAARRPPRPRRSTSPSRSASTRLARSRTGTSRGPRSS